MLDLAIAGGGPIGLATALYAARAGLEVTVFEPRAGVIDKACGEGLMPGAISSLLALGVEPDGLALRGIRYLAGTRSAEAQFRSGPGRGVRRTTLHATLRDTVDAAGVPVIHEAVSDVTQDGDSVLVNGVRARYLVAADGLHSPTRRALGLEASAGRSRRFGLRSHVEMVPWTDFVEVHWSRLAEAYVTPVAPGLVGIALLTSSRVSFEEQLRCFPELHDRVAGLSMSPVRGAGPLHQRSRRRTAGRVLLVGDASGYVDALTGEGIAVGLGQARAAVAAICADDPRGYEWSWRRATWRYQVLTRTLLGVAAVPPARKALVPLASRLPAVFSAAVNELARPA